MLLHHLTKESDGRTSKHLVPNYLIHSQPATVGNYVSTGHGELQGNGTSELGMSELTDHGKNSKCDDNSYQERKKDSSLVVHMW